MVYANRGAGALSGVTVNTTLAAGLSYVSDTSGVTPTIDISGDTVLTWHLPDLAFLEARRFTITVGVPAQSAYGERYDANLAIGGTGIVPGPGQTDSIQVMTAHQTFLPLSIR